jgi:uncharacterized membrane protein (TIGR02234 family)
MPEGRRWFGPVLLAGAAGSGACALAGAKPWAAPDVHAGATLVDTAGGQIPLATALGLAGLAGWGVLLVTRRTVRRLVAWLGAVVAVGMVATAVVGRSTALDSARRATVDLGRTPTGTHTTGWWVLALAGSVLALWASAVAVRDALDWPEMGSRYDAPVGSRQTRDPAEMEDVELWRAIDQGRDPTDPGEH